jgi:membrane protease subunit (stomatin/prohibitin family)
VDGGWRRLFESPFKSDVYFFSTRQQVDQRWGTPQPITIRDKDFGAVRLPAFGNYSYRVADPKLFHTQLSGTRDVYTVAELDGQLRGMILQHISDAIASSGIPFLDLATNQTEFARALSTELDPAFAAIGLKLEGMTVQNLSLPEELQKLLDQRIGMGMVGNDMGRFIQYQTAQAIPEMAKGAASGSGGGIAGIAMGQVLAKNLQEGLQGGAASQAAQAAQPPVGTGGIVAVQDAVAQPGPLRHRLTRASALRSRRPGPARRARSARSRSR